MYHKASFTKGLRGNVSIAQALEKGEKKHNRSLFKVDGFLIFYAHYYAQKWENLKKSNWTYAKSNS